MKPFSAIKVFTRKYEQRTLGNVNKLMDTCFNIGATKTIDLKIRENLHILENNSKKKKTKKKEKKHTADRRLTSSQENSETLLFHYQNTAITNLVDPDNLL